jgi:hypothetical protein
MKKIPRLAIRSEKNEVLCTGVVHIALNFYSGLRVEPALDAARGG